MAIEWTRAFDNYCERTDPRYWAEPVNAATNAAFLIAAVVMWRRSGGVPPARFLSGVLFVIGVGSYLFHTHATLWAVLLDVVPIMMFALTYVFLANRDYWGWRTWAAALGAAAYIPYSWIMGAAFGQLPFFAISAGYWPLPLLIFIYGWLLRQRGPVGRNLMIGAGILCLSLTARSLDAAFCAAIPVGTHFLWHVLNAVMLGWMIETYVRHRRAALAT